jgi:hypothetical protein
VLAIVSLVCGIIGIFPGCCCVLIGVPFQLGALITGGIVIANPAAPGRPLAIGGVVLGVIGLLWVAFALVLNLMNPDLARQLQEMQQMQQNR